MAVAWLKAAGKFKVEHMPMPHPGVRVSGPGPKVGVLHTIEGSLESGLSVFRRHFAPTFTVGRDRNGKVRILQHIPLGYMAAALENHSGGVETNREAEVQIELAGHSSQQPWLPDAGVLDALTSLMAVLSVNPGIPLTRPYPDLMPALPWASYSFPRRRDGKFNRVSGWYGHVEVPENAHWDPGAFRWTVALNAAKVKAAPTPSLAAIGDRDWAFGRWYLGLGEYARYGRRNTRVRPMGYPAKVPANGWRAVEWYVDHVLNKPRTLDAARTLPLKVAAMQAVPAPAHA